MLEFFPGLPGPVGADASYCMGNTEGNAVGSAPSVAPRAAARMGRARRPMGSGAPWGGKAGSPAKIDGDSRKNHSRD